jgi:hypothetical protein
MHIGMLCQLYPTLIVLCVQLQQAARDADKRRKTWEEERKQVDLDIDL